MDNLTKNIILSPLNLLYKLSPKLTLKILFRLKVGKKLNLKNPVTYNEKLQWIKLYDKNDLMPKCCDKYTVREYVESRGCGEILNELLWQGFNPKDIPFDSLPDQFVIKVTHGSGLNIICTDKSKLNVKETIDRLNKWLKVKYLPCYGEWFYGIVKPRIIIEKFLSEEDQEIPVDYKMFCFNNFERNNVVGITAVDTDRFTHHKRKVYDSEWNLFSNVCINFPYDEVKEFEKPIQYEKMLEYAKKLSAPFSHARVDFYVVRGKIYFGEITFTSDAGFGRIKPYSFDKKMGSWLKLPI